MHFQRFADYQSLSEHTANEIVQAIQQNPYLTLCMASGHTPTLTCELLVEKLSEGTTDYSSVNFIGLDEWVGLPSENEGSCHYFFKNKLLGPLDWPAAQVHLFNGQSDDLQAACIGMDELIKSLGGIDMMIVGIGMNGHIGFNEPGTAFDTKCHVANLDETTIDVGQKYFTEKTNLGQGITIGLQHLRNTKKVILMANGEKKSTVINQTLNGPVTEQFPASIMQTLPNGYVYADEAACSILKES